MFLRITDIVLSLTGLVVTSPFLFILLIVGYFDTGSPIFSQQRVGKHTKPFQLLKFRTMKKDTQSVATHLVDASAITPFGAFLRKTKLDELPQLFNVLVGEMSLVGPRPCLFNQQELINERQKRGVYEHKPGITGLAQVNLIDMSSPVLLAEMDQKMLKELSITSYFKYVLATVIGKGAGDRVVK